jgi:hypothetical protein
MSEPLPHDLPEPPPPPPPICKKVGCSNIATHMKSLGIFRTCEQHQLAQKWTPICSDPTCIEKALYGFPGKKQTHCKIHYEDGMRNPYIVYCVMCERDSTLSASYKKQASFGRRCRKPSFCAEHNKETMYANVMKGGDCRDGCDQCYERRNMVFDEVRDLYVVKNGYS